MPWKVTMLVVSTTLAIAIVFTPGASLADSKQNRWGIEVKDTKPIDDKADSEIIDHQTSPAVSPYQKTKANQPQPATSISSPNEPALPQAKSKESTSTQRSSEGHSSPPPIIDSGSMQKPPSKTFGSAEPIDGVEKPEIEAPVPRKTIKWTNEAQKQKCTNYLVELREQFLLARHHSIQGESCGTGKHSRNFLKIVEDCKRDCPPNFLSHNGYTTRIIRNLSFLEKLGTERCSEIDRGSVQSIDRKNPPAKSSIRSE